MHKKVKAGGVAGAIITLVVAVLAALGVDLTAAESAGVTVLASVVAGYLKAA